MNDVEKHDAVLLENFKLWQNKKLYLELMQRFIDEEIDGVCFETEFYKMWREDTDRNYSSIELLDIAEHVDLTQFMGLARIMSKLFTDCDVFEANPAWRGPEEISEEELRDCVKEAFLQIKNYP